VNPLYLLGISPFLGRDGVAREFFVKEFASYEVAKNKKKLLSLPMYWNKYSLKVGRTFTALFAKYDTWPLCIAKCKPIKLQYRLKKLNDSSWVQKCFINLQSATNIHTFQPRFQSFIEL
jgi:hypothetical protein